MIGITCINRIAASAANDMGCLWALGGREALTPPAPALTLHVTELQVEFAYALTRDTGDMVLADAVQWLRSFAGALP